MQLDYGSGVESVVSGTNSGYQGTEKMKNSLIALLAVVVFGMVFSNFSPAQTGADMFKSKCAMCHGPDGKGQTAMGKNLNLRDLGSAEVQSQSDTDLTNIITNGKGKMPKYDGKLTGDQITDVVKFIRTLRH
jgi:cytochrome c6